MRFNQIKLIICLILIFGGIQISSFSSMALGEDPAIQEKEILNAKIIKDLLSTGQTVKIFLEGDVELSFQAGGCSGCSGGCDISDISYLIEDTNIYLYARAGNCSCEGNCEAYWPAFGKFVLKGLVPQQYTLYFPQTLSIMSSINE